MKLQQNKEISIDNWETLLQKSSNTSPFQTPGFYNSINQITGFSSEVFAVFDNGELTSLCVVTLQKEPGLKGFFSSRAIVYGGPVLLYHSDLYLEVLIKGILKSLKRRSIYLEIRSFFDYTIYDKVYQDLGFCIIPRLNIKVYLSRRSLEEILASMKYNRRREIKISLEGGAYYREAKNDDEVEAVYNILKNLYLNRVKLPIPALNFFLALNRSSVGKTFIVIHNNSIIGGAFTLFSNSSGIYTMYYCGIRDYNKNIFPTHLAILAAIDFGLKNNLSYIDFMGAGIKEEEYGVRKYKQEFGGSLEESRRYLRVLNPLLYFIGRLGIQILKKM